MRTVASALAVTLFVPALLVAGGGTKASRPRLELRAFPRVAFSPALVTATAELRGGDDVEDFYCPEVEWVWSDGSRSVHGEDCPPFEEGVTLERRFSAEHAFRRAGTYTVKVIMRRGSRVLSVAHTSVNVRAGVADFSED